MKKIFWQCMIPMVLWTIAACKKDKEIAQKSPAQLLTDKEWMLFSIGYDSNNNGMIDNNEEMIKDCEKDNTIRFVSDGRAFFVDKGINCAGPLENNFNWEFINNYTGIEIEEAVVTILKLDENDFIYTPKLEGVTPNLIIHFRH